jgi:excisionase family DNA binding protein
MSFEPESEDVPPVYLTAREAAPYLRLNEKTLYALVQDGAVPATKVTGKWLFPKALLDDWLLASAHGGALADRLLIAGSDDPLLAHACARLAAEQGDEALVALSPTGTELGLRLLARRRVNTVGIHWGHAETSVAAHAELVRRFPAHAEWTVVRLGLREQGVIVAADCAAAGLTDLATPDHRWAARQAGAGSQHFFGLMLAEQGIAPQSVRVVETAYSERQAASLVALGAVDCAPGVRAAASEFGLGFLPLAWEAYDLVLPRDAYFRTLFQALLAMLASASVRAAATRLGGYDLASLGRLTALK